MRHVPAWLFDVFGECIVIKIMLVNCAVRMPVSDDMTVTFTVRLGKNKADVIVACVSGCHFGGSHKHPLPGKVHRGHDHDDGSQAP